MNKKRKRNYSLWVISFLILTGSVLLFLGGPGYYASRSLKYFWDTGHILYFALVTVLLIRWGPVSRLPSIWQWISILAITFLLGISIEIMQYGTTRTPNAGDVLRDLTGSLVVLVFGPPGSRLQPVIRRRALQLAIFVLILVQLWPLTRSLIDEAISRHQFPLLSGFETPFEIERWDGGDRLSVEPVSPTSTERLLRLTLTTDEYSGTELKYFDGDWTSARQLKVKFYNPDTTPLQITCRIHDLQHSDGNEEYEDRYNRSLLLTPGWNPVEIDLDDVKHSPSGRVMDMSRIRSVMFFAVSLPVLRTVYLDEVRLVYGE